MKKPTKEQRAKWSRNYAEKNKEVIAKRRKVLNPIKNNQTEIQSAVMQQEKNRIAFNKSYFGREYINK